MRSWLVCVFTFLAACGGEKAQATAPELPAAQGAAAPTQAPLARTPAVAPTVPEPVAKPTPQPPSSAAEPAPVSLCSDLDAWLPKLRKASSDAANILAEWRIRKAAFDSTLKDPNKLSIADYRMFLGMMDKMSRDTGGRAQELKRRLAVLEQQRVPAEEEPIRKDLSNGYSAVVTCFEQHSAAWGEGISAMNKIAAVGQLCGEIKSAAGKLEREVRGTCKRLQRSNGSELARAERTGAKSPGKCVPCRYNGDCDVLQSEDGECCLPIKGDDEAHEAECRANGPLNLPPSD